MNAKYRPSSEMFLLELNQEEFLRIQGGTPLDGSIFYTNDGSSGAISPLPLKIETSLLPVAFSAPPKGSGKYKRILEAPGLLIIERHEDVRIILYADEEEEIWHTIEDGTFEQRFSSGGSVRISLNG